MFSCWWNTELIFGCFKTPGLTCCICLNRSLINAKCLSFGDSEIVTFFLFFSFFLLFFFSFFFLEAGGKMSLGCQEAFEVFKQDHADSITIEDNKELLKQR